MPLSAHDYASAELRWRDPGGPLSEPALPMHAKSLRILRGANLVVVDGAFLTVNPALFRSLD